MDNDVLILLRGRWAVWKSRGLGGSLDVLTCKMGLQGRMTNGPLDGTLVTSFAISSMTPVIWQDSNHWVPSLRGTLVLPFFVSVSTTLLLFQWSVFYCSWIRWGPCFPGWHWTSLLPKHMDLLVSALKVLCLGSEHVGQTENEPGWSKKGHTCQEGGSEAWL